MKLNKNLRIVDGEPTVSTGVISDNTANEHKSVIQLVDKYEYDFKEFGGVTFEMEPFETPGGVQRRRIARLNHDQCALLMTYLRNSSVVREFKKRLIWAFREAREHSQFQIPTTLGGALQLAADQQKQIESLATKIKRDTPKVEYVDSYMDSEGLRGLQEAAKSLHFKPRKFTDALHRDGFLYRQGDKMGEHRTLTAYQCYLERGIFQIVEGERRGHNYNQTKITAKGMVYFAKRYRQEFAA